MPPLATALGRRSESARWALKARFRSDARLARDPAWGTLKEQFPQLANLAHDQVSEPLLKQVNKAARSIREPNLGSSTIGHPETCAGN